MNPRSPLLIKARDLLDRIVAVRAQVKQAMEETVRAQKDQQGSLDLHHQRLKAVVAAAAELGGLRQAVEVLAS